MLKPVLIHGIYDFIEAVIDTALDSIENILIFVGKNDMDYQVNMSVQCGCDLSCLADQIPMLISEYDEDGIWYLSLTFDKGGEPV